MFSSSDGFFLQNMKNHSWIMRSLLAGALLMSVPAVRCATFQDVLDLPSASSKIAERSLINGMAQAGMRLVGVGQRGHILFSDDQGKSWAQAKVPVSSDLVAVHFPTPQQGWAVGHDGIVLHTSDAGVSWSKQLDGRSAAASMNTYYSRFDFSENWRLEAKRMLEQGPDKPFLDVWFEDEKNGFVVGAFNLIFHTEDGGLSWQPWADRTANPEAFHLNAIRAVGEDLFIVGEHGLVLKKSKGSARFEALKTPYQGSFFGLVGSANALIVYGLRGNAYRSIDQGLSWQKIETGLALGLTAASLLPDGRFVLLSQGGHVLLSRDQGASFQMLKQARPAPTSAVIAVGNSALLVGGARGVRVQALDLP